MIFHPSVAHLILDPVDSSLSLQLEVRKPQIISVIQRTTVLLFLFSHIGSQERPRFCNDPSELTELIFPSFPMMCFSVDFTSFSSSMGGMDSMGGGMGNFRSVSTSTRIVNGKRTTTKKCVKLIRCYIYHHLLCLCLC